MKSLNSLLLVLLDYLTKNAHGMYRRNAFLIIIVDKERRWFFNRPQKHHSRFPIFICYAKYWQSS